MKSKLFFFTTWLASDPRRAFVILFVILMILALTTAVIPNAAVLAGEATSGS